MKGLNTYSRDIARMLINGEEVTPLKIMQQLGAVRLGAIIFDLRQRGFDILTEKRKAKSGQNYANYYMKSKTSKNKLAKYYDLKEEKKND